MRSGAALLVVLFLVMTVTVITLGFLSDSNMQMVCGKNVGLRMQMDYLADSGLVIAKTLLLNPQKVDTSAVGYWQGGGVQIDESSEDYIDIFKITQSAAGPTNPTNRCTYDIECTAYRENGASRIAQSYLKAQLRLDPCIAYWAGGVGNADIPTNLTINGDVYSKGGVTISGAVEGDVFADSVSVTGAKTGQTYAPADAIVLYPDIAIDFFSPLYEYQELSYAPDSLAVGDCNSPAAFIAGGSNPAGIFYCTGNLNLMCTVIINGTLVVDGNLTIMDSANVVITASKNFPALVVGGHVRVEDSSCVTANGLVQVGSMTVAADAGNIDITGALFVENSALIVDPSYSHNITVTIAPMISAVTMSSGGNWSPAGDAFFKYIKRD